MKTKALQITAAIIAILVTAIGLVLINANSSAATSAANLTSASAQAEKAQPVLDLPYTPECGPDWTLVPTPTVGPPEGQLSGIAAVSAEDLWAWGRDWGLLEYWDGSTWSAVSYEPIGDIDHLSDVAGVSANDVWAVGLSVTEPSIYRALTMHWDGSEWSAVPNPTMGSESYLGGIAVVSANDVWAVGQYRDSSTRPLTMHWDGSEWSVVPSPSVGTFSGLGDVAAISSNDIWAVGYVGTGENMLVMHWDGSAWSIVPTPIIEGWNSLSSVSAVSSNDVWAVGEMTLATHQPLAIHWDGSAWSVVSSPTVGAYGYLRGVGAVSASDVWAVGAYSNNNSQTQTLIEHWDGLSWSVMPSPDMGPGSYLGGVAVVSGSDIWAAGMYHNSSANRDQTLIEHWDGSAWSVVPSDNFGCNCGTFEGITAVSANDVWAVGYHDDSDVGAYRTLIEHWDGSAWSVVPSPNASTYDNYLQAVSGVSNDDLWAVGRYRYSTSESEYKTLTMHWDGSMWSVVPGPDTGTGYTALTGVAAVSANDAWAVGRYHNSTVGRDLTLIEHWDGSAWSVASSPNVGDHSNYLTGVTAISSNDVWAVGYTGNGSHTLTVHWSGGVWSVVPSPDPPDDVTLASSFNAVDALSSTDAWAVGRRLVEVSPMPAENQQWMTFVERWNGSTWNVVYTPHEDLYELEPSLTGVAAVSANDVWAVGYYDSDTNFYTFHPRTLIEHWDGSAWSIVPSPDLGALDTTLYGVAVSSGNSVWAGGYYEIGRTLIERYDPCPTIPTPAPTATATPSACAIQFTDVPSDSTFYSFVRCMACRGIINGYTSGCETGGLCFKPNNNVTRGQLAKIVANAAHFTETTGEQQYQDVAPGSTFYDYIWRLSDRDYVSGYTCGGVGEPCGPASLPYFRPNGNASRGQISKIVSNAAGLSDPPGDRLFEDVEPASPFYDFIQRLGSRGVMSGYLCGGVGEPCGPDSLPYFRPGNNATRGQTSKIVANTFYPDCQTRGLQFR